MHWTMLFDGWVSIGRTVLIGILGYAGLVMLLRISGKRTLTKMNAYDLVVSVALGSCLASMLLSKNVSLVTGISAFALLIALQFLVAWSSVRSKLVRKLAMSEPRLLVHQGKLLEQAMTAERVSRDDVLTSIRSHGYGGLEEIGAVILETDGSFSVVQSVSSSQDKAMEPVESH